MSYLVIDEHGHVTRVTETREPVPAVRDALSQLLSNRHDQIIVRDFAPAPVENARGNLHLALNTQTQKAIVAGVLQYIPLRAMWTPDLDGFFRLRASEERNEDCGVDLIYRITDFGEMLPVFIAAFTGEERAFDSARVALFDLPNNRIVSPGFPNLYDDGRVCMGDDIKTYPNPEPDNSRTYSGQWARVLEYYTNSSHNADLFNYERRLRLRTFIRVNPETSEHAPAEPAEVVYSREMAISDEDINWIGGVLHGQR